MVSLISIILFGIGIISISYKLYIELKTKKLLTKTALKEQEWIRISEDKDLTNKIVLLNTILSYYFFFILGSGFLALYNSGLFGSYINLPRFDIKTEEFLLNIFFVELVIGLSLMAFNQFLDLCDEKVHKRFNIFHNKYAAMGMLLGLAYCLICIQYTVARVNITLADFFCIYFIAIVGAIFLLSMFFKEGSKIYSTIAPFFIGLIGMILLSAYIGLIAQSSGKFKTYYSPYLHQTLHYGNGKSIRLEFYSSIKNEISKLNLYSDDIDKQIEKLKDKFHKGNSND